MGEPLAVRCADVSAKRSELMAGTASRVQRWLLIEQPGPWGVDAPGDSRLDPTISEAIEANAGDAGVRVVLIRRPGWEPAGRRRVVFLAHTGRESSWLERLAVAPADLPSIDLSVVADDTPPGLGDTASDVHLVCTNGRHDPCCADLGRPVARALHDGGVKEVWESSHVGGDRFAANVVHLPTGVYLGRVDPLTGPDVVRDLHKGHLHLENYRGRSCWPPLVQAAEWYLRQETGELGLHDLIVQGSNGGADSMTVRFRLGGDRGVFDVLVHREPADEAQLTCRADRLHRPWLYLLDSISAPEA